ncbi:MAG: hypothetical protein LH616_11645 [Ilumatobacteraceae bacterium]|nr:hypothetical protein [Ilumatobacteraceae bacterium]
MDKMARSAAYTRGTFISPAIRAAGSDAMRQIQEEFPLMKRRVLLTGTLSARAGSAGRPRPESPVDLPLARVEAAGCRTRSPKKTIAAFSAIRFDAETAM